MDDDTTPKTSDDATDKPGGGPGATPEDIETKPPGNPPVDEDAVAEGEEKLGTVKPY